MRQVLFSRRNNPMQSRAKNWRKEAWWQKRRIDPLAIAKGLWNKTINAKKSVSSGQPS